MYQLFVSYDCGSAYGFDREAETLEKLEPRMRELDEQMLRWYVEKDGEDCPGAMCGIHANIIATMETLNAEARAKGEGDD